MLGEPVHMLTCEGRTHIHAPAPAARDTETWQALYEVLRTADSYGSQDTASAPEIWAEVRDGVSA
ncbi:hypothetical protein AB9Q10_16490 [Streptomyces krungchingensis]|uniref:hypothetical protein n=1 Tax=Streptomyces krungchingensis TaxID=1565034 RepID=UPI003CE95136